MSLCCRNGFAQAFNEFKKVKDFFTNGSSAGDIVVKGPKAAVFAGNTRAALQAIESSLIQAVGLMDAHVVALQYRQRHATSMI